MTYIEEYFFCIWFVMDIKKLEQRILDLERILGLTNDDKLPEMCLGESLLTTQQ